MTTLDNGDLLMRITTEYGYPLPRAESAVQKLLNLQPQLRPAFEAWWGSGHFPDIEVEGYSIESLMKEFGMNPIAAFLALDWLIRDPETARALIKRGFDRIVTGSGSHE